MGILCKGTCVIALLSSKVWFEVTTAVFALCCHLGVKTDGLGGFRVGEKTGATNVFSNSVFRIQWVALLTKIYKIYFI